MKVPRTKATPTPFGPERAREILAADRLFYGLPESAYTPGEDEYVREVWETLPGTYSWMDTLRHIAKGKVKL